MKALSLASPRDFLALARRRKWWIIVPFFALSATSIFLTRLLPSIYVSEALILIQPREVPTDFVRDLISVSTEQRLNAIQQTILSRTNLLRIVREFESNNRYLRGQTDDGRVNHLRKDIKVDLQADPRRNMAINYFRVGYQNENAELAQKITSRLASLFIEYDNQNREEQVFGTTEFITSELQKVSEELARVDNTLRQFKERHRHELPEQLDTNLRTLDRLEVQMRANGEALDRYVSMRLALERQISETPAVVSTEVTGGPKALRRNAPSPLVEEFRQKERQHKELISKYTDKHPDVLRLKAELERLKKEIPPQDFAQIQELALLEMTTVTSPNPVYQNLLAQLREVKTEISIREKEKKYLQSEIAQSSQRVQNAPRREQEIEAVRRAYSDLSKQHDDLRGKLVQAKLAGSLESRQKGSQFVVMDPATLPLAPSTPDRTSLLLIGIGASFVLGLVLAVLVEFVNPKIWSHVELEELLGMPLLVEIPQIFSHEDLSRARRLKALQAVAFTVFAAVYVGALSMIYLTPRLKFAAMRRLDPLIELIINFQ